MNIFPSRLSGERENELKINILFFGRGAGIVSTFKSEKLYGQPASIKMLYLVGLGLADEKDITVRGLEVVKSASRVYLEAYTSILLVEKEKLVGANSVSVCPFIDTLADCLCRQSVGSLLWTACDCRGS